MTKFIQSSDVPWLKTPKGTIWVSTGMDSCIQPEDPSLWDSQFGVDLDLLDVEDSLLFKATGDTEDAANKNIVAVLKKKYLKTYWGFVFDTDIQMYVERFMQKIHVSDSDYILWFEDEAPAGIYTAVKVEEVRDDSGNLIDAKFNL